MKRLAASFGLALLLLSNVTTAAQNKTGLQIVHAVRSQGVPSDIPEAERTEQVSVLDIAGGIASAKLVTPHWVDYMTLLKSEGGWKIVSVVQQIGD